MTAIEFSPVLVSSLFLLAIVATAFIAQAMRDVPPPTPDKEPMTTVTVIVKDPAIRQGAIARALNLWESSITGETLDACTAYLATRDPAVLDHGDPPPRIMVDALVNGYWYVGGVGDSTHPDKDSPVNGTWAYECFWLHGDDLDEHGYTLTDLGPGAGTRSEACHWLLDAWKELRG